MTPTNWELVRLVYAAFVAPACAAVFVGCWLWLESQGVRHEQRQG